jgi:hypothetical protein
VAEALGLDRPVPRDRRWTPSRSGTGRSRYIGAMLAEVAVARRRQGEPVQHLATLAGLKPKAMSAALARRTQEERLMGYHPETLAFSFPPYPSGGMSLIGHPQPPSLGRALYALKPWVGFDVWHIDPEKRGTGNRTDDSCGWFDRTPGDYADAVAYLLKDASTCTTSACRWPDASPCRSRFTKAYRSVTPRACACLLERPWRWC